MSVLSHNVITMEPAVVPVLVGPLQVLFAILPGLILAVLGAVVSLLKPSAMLALLKVLWRLKVAVSIAVVAVGLLVWGARTFLPRWWGGTASAAQVGGGDWLVFRGSLARTGWAADQEGPGGGGVNWMHRSGGESFLSSPAVVGNRVYVASADMGVISESGTIYCLDADSGAVAWKAAPRGYRPTFSSPVVWKDYLVCGEGLHVTRDARVICLDLRPGREGQVRWTYRTNSHVECAPVIADGRVYVGAGDDGYYCFELEPDAAGNARVVWHLEGKDYPDAETSLAVHEGKVYAGLGLGGRALCVLDAATGRELKRLPTPYPVFGPPAIAGGKLYIGMGNGDFVKTAEEVLADRLKAMRQQGASEAEIAAARATLGPAGEVWCIDLATLNVDWKYKVGRTVLGAVAVAGDRLYFGSRDGNLYCLARDGRLLGQWNAHAPIVTSPAVTDRHVYFITNTGTIHGLDRHTLEPFWQLAVSTRPLCISSPAVARGRLYVGTQHDGFICAGQPQQRRQVPVWAGHLGGPGRGGNLDSSPLPEAGTLHWQYPPDQAGQTTDAVVSAPPAILSGRVFVPLASGLRKGVAVLPADANTDQTPAELAILPTDQHVTRSPAVVGDLALVVDGGPGETSRHLHAFDVTSAKELWRYLIVAGASGAMTASADMVLLVDQPRAVTCLALDGRALWSAGVGLVEHPPAATSTMIVVAVDDPPMLVALDRSSGAELWRVALEHKALAAPVVHKTTIWLATDRGIEARSLIDGAPLPAWRLDGGPATGDLVVGTRVIAYTSAAGQVVVLSREDGTVLRRIDGAAGNMPPLLSGDWLLYFGKDGPMRVSLADESSPPMLWMDTAWLGKPVTPMVLAESRLYIGIPGWGMVRLGANP